MWRANIFFESLFVPGYAGRFVGRRIVEAFERAGLATINGVERRSELDFCVRPDVVAGGAQPPEHLLAGSGILCQRRAGRCCKRNSGNHPYLHPFFSSSVPVVITGESIDCRDWTV